MDFIDLGYGTEKEIVSRLPDNGKWTVIRDDDAAVVGAPCWIATKYGPSEARNRHLADGGTVSDIFEILNKEEVK